MTPLKSFFAVLGLVAAIVLLSNWETVAAEFLNEASDISVGAGLAMFALLLAGGVALCVNLAKRKR